MAYYLEGVDWTARQTIATTTDLVDLFRADRERISTMARSRTALRAYEVLQSRVVVSIRRLAESLEVSVPTATTAVKRLEVLGIAREITGKSYGRLFAYDHQLEILNRTGDPASESAGVPVSRADVWRRGFERAKE